MTSKSISKNCFWFNVVHISQQLNIPAAPYKKVSEKGHNEKN